MNDTFIIISSSSFSQPPLRYTIITNSRQQHRHHTLCSTRSFSYIYISIYYLAIVFINHVFTYIYHKTL
ncbi:hypothetical protein BCR42DRAFT_419399 [Absidia repens]|uniref:Uncharacterized protein n=1 Tax=Absidia repens TaxID=90262 RepID=A0A1X2IB85_9FUNG|nr:hypothetical protein BCR42DRAFT_419399 [Absidia repens]